MGGSQSKKKPATSTTTLQLANQGVNEIPSKMLHEEQLEEVWLQGNQFTELPEEIGNWKRLILFYVMDNQLTEIPEAVNHWIELEEVNFRYG